ncbi:MAG: KTSC domain-containing protein [Myxococcales bacterium]|nr:KTSC domain-containing protein [Myxococcales bacterium]
MRRQPVSSSNLRSVGYDEGSETLEIEFHSGGVYRYRQVAQAVHDALLAADSKGRFFNAYIKDRYPFVRAA